MVERPHVRQGVMAGGNKNGLSAPMLADLVKQPGIANRAAADHQPFCAGESQHLVRFLRGINIAVGQHGKRQLRHCPADVIVMHFAAIHLGDRSAMHGQQINRVPRENR